MSGSLRQWLIPLAWLVPTGILIQAVLAGRGLFVDPTLFGLHGNLGNALLLIAVAVAVLAWMSKAGNAAVLLALLTTVGMVAQIGLGYAGRRSAAIEASATHVPLGVALLGLSVAVALLLMRDRDRSGEATA